MSFRRILLLIFAAVVLVALNATWARVAIAAQPTPGPTFTSDDIGLSGTTPSFAENNYWTFSWAYDGGHECNFRVDVNYGSSQEVLAYGGDASAGHDLVTVVGSALSLQVGSSCAWSITVDAQPPTTTLGAATFSSSDYGSGGQTDLFSEDGPSTLSYSYTCTGSPFILEAADTTTAAQSGDFGSFTSPPSTTSGQGTLRATTPGIFVADVYGPTCSWSLTVTPGPSTTAHCNGTLPTGSVVGAAETSDGNGYWIVDSQGAVVACGDATPLPSTASPPPTHDIVGITPAPVGEGFWLVSSFGSVFPFGSAMPHGDAEQAHLNAPIVGMAADPATGGYWLLGADGGVFSYDASFFGSTGNIKLNKPAVGMQAAPDGKGYWFVASDGGIFAYGTAPFEGSTGNVTLNKPVVGMAVDQATGGYWLDASDGGVFAFNAEFHGSTGNLRLAEPCVGLFGMPDGGGYRFAAADGGIFSFGDAPFVGSAA